MAKKTDNSGGDSKVLPVVVQRVLAARRCSTPIIAISTPDPAATIHMLNMHIPDIQKHDGQDKPVPKIQWDVCRGVRPINEAGSRLVKSFFGGERFDSEPVAFLSKIQATDIPATNGGTLPPNSVVFFMNAQRFFESTGVIQGIWNLRDTFKADRKTLILLAPEFNLPPELAKDVIVLDEPLPERDELKSIIVDLHDSTGLPRPSEQSLGKAIDAVQGLAAFTAEQVISMSLRRDGIDINEAWEHKKKMISTTRGLDVWRGGETFDDIGGVANIKGYMADILKGRNAPNAIVFIDEIEKAFAGLGQNGGPGDSSGVTQDFLGTLLSYMQDNNATGLIFIGPAGSAKSMVAKAAGTVTDIPTISFDISGMKGSLVGESEQNLRMALKTVTAVSNKNPLFIATCNSIHVLPPELRRRFKLGTFFFDLPTAEEREVIWKIYLKKYDLPLNSPRPDDDSWTGAEIAQCCDNAYRLRSDLIRGSKTIVPVAKSAQAVIRDLRRMADQVFISASYEGLYRCPESADDTVPCDTKIARRIAGFDD